MNNKGVTLIELLIVIVIIGIISAFAVPAVNSYLDSAKKNAVYQDAVAIRNAADSYCAQNDCTVATYNQISSLISNFDATKYDETADGTVTVATNGANGWIISLESASDDGSYEWVDADTDPLVGSADDVTVDAD